MDILNFISWIKGGRLVKTVNPKQSLLPIAVRDTKRDDSWLTNSMTVEDFVTQFGSSNQVLGISIWANGFMSTGCINEDITLPTPGSFTHTSPLAMCVGKTLTIPVGTTLTIV